MGPKMKKASRESILAGWDEALAEISEGKPPFRVCKDRGWPWATFSAVAEERADAYARARDAGWRALADECMTISDDGSNDTYVDEDGRTRTDHDVIARSRLRVDTRKWLLSKMLPKVYGERTAVEMGGPDGGPITLSFESLLPRANPATPAPSAPLPGDGSTGSGKVGGTP